MRHLGHRLVGETWDRISSVVSPGVDISRTLMDWLEGVKSGVRRNDGFWSVGRVRKRTTRHNRGWWQCFECCIPLDMQRPREGEGRRTRVRKAREQEGRQGQRQAPEHPRNGNSWESPVSSSASEIQESWSTKDVGGCDQCRLVTRGWGSRVLSSLSF